MGMVSDLLKSADNNVLDQFIRKAAENPLEVSREDLNAAMEYLCKSERRDDESLAQTHARLLKVDPRMKKLYEAESRRFTFGLTD